MGGEERGVDLPKEWHFPKWESSGTGQAVQLLCDPKAKVWKLGESIVV